LDAAVADVAVDAAGAAAVLALGNVASDGVALRLSPGWVAHDARKTLNTTRVSAWVDTRKA